METHSKNNPTNRGSPRAALISGHQELRTAILGSLSGVAQIIECPVKEQVSTGGMTLYPDSASVLQQHPDVCFIDVGSKEDGLALIREVAAANVPVAALHVNNDSALILRSFRCGASEFLFAPIQPDELHEVFERLIQKTGVSQGPARLGKIWTVMPAKPSYGATTISCNLAVRLRHAVRPVLLADMDPLLGSVSFSLKLKSAFSFMDAVNHGIQIDKELWKKIIVPYDGVDVLLGPEIPRFETPQSAGMPAFLQFVRLNYAAAVLDSPGPLSDWHLALARSADDVLLVTTNELAAVHAALRAIQLLESAGTERNRIRLIVNRYEKENGLVREAIEMALKLKVFWTLPNDYGPVQKSVLDGKPVPSSCRLGQALDELVRHLTGVATPSKPRWKPASLLDFFLQKRA